MSDKDIKLLGTPVSVDKKHRITIPNEFVKSCNIKTQVEVLLCTYEGRRAIIMLPRED